MYTIGPLPKEAPAWLVRELLEIGASMEVPRQITPFAPLAAAPEKPREGMMVVAESPWDPGYGFGPYVRSGGTWLPMFGAAIGEAVIIACSDETTDLATGTAVVTFRMPYRFAIDEVRASVTTAPTGAALIVDINAGVNSILSTRITVDAGELTSTTAATPAVVSTGTIADDTQMTIDIDQVGSTVAGAGLKVTIIGRRVST